MDDPEIFGGPCLRLLSDPAAASILIHLRQAPAPTRDLLELGTGLGYPTLMSRVRLLAKHRLVDRGTEVHLLTAGRAALSVIDVAAAREGEWPTDRDRFVLPGTRALSVACDSRWRAISRVLAHEPARIRDLEKLLPRLAKGTLERRLRQRREDGLLTAEKDGRDVWHGLSEHGRRLAGLGLHATRWEWVFGQRDKGLLSSDLSGIVHQLAPLVCVSDGIQGVCLFREHWHRTIDRDVYLAVRDCRVLPYVVAPLASPDAVAHGTPHEWAQALVTGDWTNIKCDGESGLIRALVRGLHKEIRA